LIASTICGRPSEHLVDLDRRHAFALQIPQGAAGGEHLEAQRRELADGGQQARLVGIAHRDEHGAARRHLGAGAELALGEGHVEGAVEADDLAGRAHLRAQHRVDAGEAGEGEHRFLDADMIERSSASG
jgi:hypothetical protein